MKNTPSNIKCDSKRAVFDVLGPKTTQTHPTKTQQFHKTSTFFHTIGVR